jgi:hypothetical protein
VYDVAFSPDGTNVLTGNDDKTARIWDVTTGLEVHKLNHDGTVHAVAFSPDGCYVLSGDRHRTLSLWNVESGKRLWTFKGHLGIVSAAGFSAGGRFLFSGSSDLSVRVWHPLPAPFANKDSPAPLSVKIALADFTTRNLDRWLTAREYVIGSAEEGVSALLQAFPPEPPDPAIPDDTALSPMRADLDNSRFDVRQKARRDLEAKGWRIAWWLNRTLKESETISPEARSSLGIVRSRLSEPVEHLQMGDLGRVRAVMTLLEMPSNKAVRQALEAYAKGPMGSWAAELARRGSRWK